MASTDWYDLNRLLIGSNLQSYVIAIRNVI